MTAGVCPYCRSKIVAEDGPMVCEGCGTAHHPDCYAENGGCTIFGCSKAPGDEPKMSVSTPELVTAAVPAAVGQTRSPLPPPPPPGSVFPQTITPSTTEDLRQVANRVVPSMFGGFSGNYASEPIAEEVVHPPKNRSSYIMLGALLGAFGAHNFYAGYYKKAGFQLAITVLTLGFGSPMSWMWAVIDICTIDRDVRGVQFES
jgi:TM2 domain-containing membrane protein YozV